MADLIPAGIDSTTGRPQQLTSADDLKDTSGSADEATPVGAAGGDLGGTYPNPAVTQVGGTGASTIGAHPGLTNNPHGVTAAQAGADSSGAAAAAVAAHEGAGDPHTGYQLESEKGSANGYASLDGTAKLPAAELPTHASSHEDGGSDELSVAGLSGELADLQPPKTHASAHQNGGADEINVGGLSGTLADPQAPASHGFAGSAHSVDTLANVNAKISDATLDDSSSSRPPSGAASGDLAGTYPSPSVVSASETTAGKIEIATQAETDTGTDDARAVTPKKLHCPKCKIHRTADWSVPNNSWVEVQWNGEVYDTDSMHDNATNNTRITIPSGRGGTYLIHAQVAWDGSTTGRREMIIGVNGNFVSPRSLYWHDPPSDQAAFVSITTIEELSAGDYVELQVYQNSGGALSIIGGREYSWFEVVKLA